MQFENLQKELSIIALEDQKRVLDGELKHLEERESAYECFLADLRKQARAHDSEVNNVQLQSQKQYKTMKQLSHEIV